MAGLQDFIQYLQAITGARGTQGQATSLFGQGNPLATPSLMGAQSGARQAAAPAAVGAGVTGPSFGMPGQGVQGGPSGAFGAPPPSFGMPSATGTPIAAPKPTPSSSVPQLGKPSTQTMADIFPPSHTPPVPDIFEHHGLSEGGDTGDDAGDDSGDGGDGGGDE